MGKITSRLTKPVPYDRLVCCMNDIKELIHKWAAISFSHKLGLVTSDKKRHVKEQTKDEYAQLYLHPTLRTPTIKKEKRKKKLEAAIQMICSISA